MVWTLGISTWISKAKSRPFLSPTLNNLSLIGNRRISEQQFSLFHHTPPRPAQPNYTLPECYTVRNTQPIEQKVTSFTEETLIYMFYANPQDRHQYLAAQELSVTSLGDPLSHAFFYPNHVLIDLRVQVQP